MSSIFLLIFFLKEKNRKLFLQVIVDYINSFYFKNMVNLGGKSMNKKKLVKCSLAIWLATQSLLHPFSYSYAEEWSKPDEEQVQTATSLNEPGGKNDLVENPLETMIQEPYENQPELEESIPNQKIAVIGPYGESPLTLGFWASVSGKPQDTVTLKEGLSRHFATDHLMFAKGYNLFDSYDGFGPLKKGMELLNGPIAEEESLMEEAYQISQKADVIVLIFGEQFLESGEGASKAHLHISKKQQRLIKKLHELNKPIIGVLYTGRPLVITDIEKYFDSLLLVWFPGTMGGIGIANLLAGKVSPSARLSMTFPRSEGQLPIYYAQTSTGRPISTSNHSERFVSKYIDESNDPLFKFGAGMSYASFESQLLRSEQKDQFIEINYLVKNRSDVSAETVTHLYLHQEYASIVQPEKRLVSSQRIYLEANQEKQARINIPISDLAIFDNNGNSWIEEGVYHFYLNVDGLESVTTWEYKQ